MTIRPRSPADRPGRRVERVLQVVGAGGDVHAGGAQGADGGEPRGAGRLVRPGPAGTGWSAAGRSTPMPAAATCSATSALAAAGCTPRLTQWLAVTGAGTRSLEHPLGQVGAGRAPSGRASRRCAGRPAGRASAAIARQRSLAPHRVGLEVRAAADDVDAAWRSPRAAGATSGSGPARRAPANRSGHDLHVDRSAQPLGGPRCSASTERQPVLRRDVGVGADRRHAVGDHQPHGPLGPLDRVVDGDQRRGSPPSPRSRPSRSPVGLGTRSARNALSRWAWGSANGGQQHVARRGRRRARRARRRASRTTAAIRSPTTRTSALEPSASVAPCRSTLRRATAGRAAGAARSSRRGAGRPLRRSGASARSSPRGSGPGSRRRSRCACRSSRSRQKPMASTASSIEPTIWIFWALRSSTVGQKSNGTFEPSGLR